LLRQTYSELYDITCLINDAYGFPILASISWMLVTFLCCLVGALSDIKSWGVTDVAYAVMCSALLFKITFFCHSNTNEAKSSLILVQKLLLEGNCRIECVEELKMLSLQLQVMTVDACNFFSLNLNLFTTVVVVMASYVLLLLCFRWNNWNVGMLIGALLPNISVKFHNRCLLS
jgi:hypothetical protein